MPEKRSFCPEVSCQEEAAETQQELCATALIYFWSTQSPRDFQAARGAGALRTLPHSFQKGSAAGLAPRVTVWTDEKQEINHQLLHLLSLQKSRQDQLGPWEVLLIRSFALWHTFLPRLLLQLRSWLGCQLEHRLSDRQLVWVDVYTGSRLVLVRGIVISC